MAGAKSAVDFNQIINADRQRRKNQDLAKQIFGKDRRASAPGAGLPKPGARLSLADRITTNGGSKLRSSSTTLNPTSFKSTGNARGGPRRALPSTGNVDADWTHDKYAFSDDPSSKPVQTSRGQNTNRGATRGHKQLNNGAALSSALNHANVIKPARSSGGMTIRGLAGPYMVVAENFAQGTTAADIESAMAPIGGTVLQCVMVSSSPVTAEITFESKDGADNVIEQFNGQTADGLVLSLYHKTSGPSGSAPKAASVQSEPSALSAPTAPRADLTKKTLSRPTRYGDTDRYQPPRERSRERRRYDERREDVTDGSYGFSDRMDTDDRADGYDSRSGGRGGLYSDNLVGGRGGRDNNRGYRNENRGDDRRGGGGRGYQGRGSR